MVNTHKQVSPFHTPSRFEERKSNITLENFQARALRYISIEVKDCMNHLADIAHLMAQRETNLEGLYALLEETMRQITQEETALEEDQALYSRYLQRANELPYDIDRFGAEIICKTYETPCPF